MKKRIRYFIIISIAVFVAGYFYSFLTYQSPRRTHVEEEVYVLVPASTREDIGPILQTPWNELVQLQPVLALDPELAPLIQDVLDQRLNLSRFANEMMSAAPVTTLICILHRHADTNNSWSERSRESQAFVLGSLYEHRPSLVGVEGVENVQFTALGPSPEGGMQYLYENASCTGFGIEHSALKRAHVAIHRKVEAGESGVYMHGTDILTDLRTDHALARVLWAASASDERPIAFVIGAMHGERIKRLAIALGMPIQLIHTE